MSTIPLSMRKGHGQTLSGDDAPRAATADNDNGELDALIDSVTETIKNRGASDGVREEVLLDAPADDDGGDGDTWRAFKAKLNNPEDAAERGPDTALDRALKAAIDRRASQESESADFQQSREWRDALHARYDGRVAIGGLLETFAGWHERMKENPHAAAGAMTAAYLAEPSYALPDVAGRPNRPGTPSGATNESPEQKLDGILTAAIDRHHGKGDGEQKAFAASARHRAALKEMFPGLSYAEACRRVVSLDGDLHRDPIAAAARLAATYGLPATTSQQVVAERNEAATAEAQQVVTATAAHMPDLVPDLADMQDDIITVLQRPEFVHGPDLQQNMLRAHRIAQLARANQARMREDDRAAPPRRDVDGIIAQAMQGGAAT